MSASRLIFSENLPNDLNDLLANYAANQIFVLTDTNSEKHCLPQLKNAEGLKAARFLTPTVEDIDLPVTRINHVNSIPARTGRHAKRPA